MEGVEKLKNGAQNSETLEKHTNRKANYLKDSPEKLNIHMEKKVEDLPVRRRSSDMLDKEYFDHLFDWNLIEQRLKESNNLNEYPQQSKAEQKILENQNIEATSVKLRDKQYSVPRSEAQRKRRSKDLLQNRRSTGFLSYEDVENAIKEIGTQIQENLTDYNENNLSNEGTKSEENVEGKAITTETFEENLNVHKDNISNVDEIDYSPVKLREKKSSSPFNSASSRKRRSRNLLLNRRSTGYVNPEDVEKAKSIDQLEDDDNNENIVII